MALIPDPVGNKTLYRSPESNPIYIYSFKDFDSNYEDEKGMTAYAYRIYVYKYTDYNSSKRPEGSVSVDNIEIPNSKSGSYVAKYMGVDSGGYEDVQEGIYVIEYVFGNIRYYYPPGKDELAILTQNISSWIYTIAVVNNRLPLKKWTVTDVINRCLELAEPLRKGQNPRFRLDGVEYVGGVAQYPYRAGSLAENDVILANYNNLQ